MRPFVDVPLFRRAKAVESETTVGLATAESRMSVQAHESFESCDIKERVSRSGIRRKQIICNLGVPCLDLTKEIWPLEGCVYRR